jgi:peroxiredoxin Q/BCP
LFEVPNSLLLLPGRVTCVIDRQGIIRLIFNSAFAAAGHVQQAKEVLRQLSGTIDAGTSA